MIDIIFGYIQIISLGFFLILVVSKTIYIRKKYNISAIKINIFTREGKKHIFEVIMFLLVCLWTFCLLIYAIDSAFDSFPGIPKIILFDFLSVKIFGLVLIITGFTIFVLALANLGNSWRLGIDDKNPGRLVTNGIYAISRHPIYLFFNFYFFGTFFINGNVIFLIFSIILGIILHFQLLREERFLLELFGKRYICYMQNVSQYFNIKIFSDFKKVVYLYKIEQSE